VTEAIEANVRAAVAEARERLSDAAERLGEEIVVVGAICSVRTGFVEWLSD